MKDKNEIVVCFCHPNTAKELGLPNDVAVTTGLIKEEQIFVVSRDEFLEWLKEGGQEMKS